MGRAHFPDACTYGKEASSTFLVLVFGVLRGTGSTSVVQAKEKRLPWAFSEGHMVWTQCILRWIDVGLSHACGSDAVSSLRHSSCIVAGTGFPTSLFTAAVALDLSCPRFSSQPTAGCRAETRDCVMGLLQKRGEVVLVSVSGIPFCC